MMEDGTWKIERVERRIDVDAGRMMDYAGCRRGRGE